MSVSLVKTLYFCTLFFLTGLAECLCGTIGWLLPLTLPVFYFMTLHLSWPRAAAAAIAAGGLLDLLLGRSFPVSVLALTALIPGAYVFRKEENSGIGDIMGSIAAGIAEAELIYVVFSSYENPLQGFLEWGLLTVFGILITTVVIRIAGAMAGSLGIPAPFVPLSTLRRKRMTQKKRRLRQS